MNSIETRQLTKRFGRTTALTNLDLVVSEGEIFGYLGPNGAGKTTTIHLLLGMIEPTGGAGHVLGFDITREADRIRDNTGALLEANGLYERISAYENLDFYGRIYRLPGKARKARIQELLEHFALWDRKDERPDSWSKGMKQKLAIARALLHHPRLLFLDEPTSGLDPASSNALRDMIKVLVMNSKVTVFLNTHNLWEAERLCDRVGIIKEGRLLALGTLDEIKSSTERKQLTIRADNWSADIVRQVVQQFDMETTSQDDEQYRFMINDLSKIPDLIRFLVSRDLSIHEVIRDEASLEQVFLDLVNTNETEIDER